MENKSIAMWSAVLLLVGGLVHLVPALDAGLTNVTQGRPWIQMIVGLLSVLLALVLFAGGKQE